MSSPFLRNRQRKLGGSHGAAGKSHVAGRAGAEATEYQLLRAQLGEDIRRLKAIQSVEKKIALKPDLLPKYDAWAEGVLDGDAGDDAPAQDDIIVQTMIWALDCGDYERALARASYVVEHGLELPARFERTAACLVAEQTAENALAAIAQEQPFDGYILLAVEQLTVDHDMPDEARAKLHKAIGLVAARDLEAAGEEIEKAGGKKAAIDFALRHLRRALALNTNAGVKKQIGALERQAKALEAKTSGE